MATSMYIKVIRKNDRETFLGVERTRDEIPLLLLNAAATLTNICKSEQLKKIPRKLKDDIFPSLEEIWSKVHEQLLTSQILNFSEVSYFYTSNLTVQNLAECLFRLSMDAPSVTYSIPSEVVLRHIFGPWSSGFKNFLMEHWESSPLLIKSQREVLEVPHVLFTSFIHTLTSEEALPRFLSSILRGMVSCPAVASNEIDSLSLLSDVKDTLGSPLKYQEDIRVVRTNLHSKLEEHYFQESSSNGLDAPKSLCADDFLKCEAAYGDGYTVALRGMEFRWNDIAAITREIASFFGQPSIGANLYVTPPNSQGLSCHYDDHCVFVCQLYGAKHWTVFPRPVIMLPRLYESLEIPQNLLAESREIVLNEGDVLYIPRGFAHKARTVTDVGARSKVRASSVHLTVAIEVEPPFEWEGFAHVALNQWSRNKGSAIIPPETSGILVAISVNILHVAIRLISSKETVFRKACLVAASSLPADTEDWLHKNQRATFDLITCKISELSSFSDSLNFIEMAIQQDGDPFHWIRWLEHLNGEEDYANDITFDGICKFLPFIYEHKDNAEATFALVKSKFCSEVLFDDAKESFKTLHDMYKEARMQYMNGMLSLHH